MSKSVIGLFVVIVVLNIIFDAMFQLHYDEAYYWVWGQNLALSYFDHPPMIAYMIRMASILGHNELITRIPALITTTILIITINQLANKMFGSKVANIATVLAIACPLIEAMFFIITPDSPLLMFWALTLYAFYYGIFENKLAYIYLAGLFAGCALLSKYTAFLIFPGIFIFLITSKNYRRFLCQKDIYLAFILAILVFSPVLWWNYHHEWVSILFQFHHGIAVKQIDWHAFGDYWGGQLLMAGPVELLALMYYSLRYVRHNITSDKLAFVFWNFSFGLIFFAYCSIFKHTEANWPGPIYISGTILLGYWLAKMNNRWVYCVSLGFIVLVLVLTKFPLTFAPQRLHNKIPGINVFFGNKELLNEVKPYLNQDTIFLACDYGNASRAWYYLHLERVYVLEQFSFAHAYSYWPEPTLPIKKAIYICDGNDLTALNTLKHYFKSVQQIKVMTYSNVISDNRIYIYQANN